MIPVGVTAAMALHLSLLSLFAVGIFLLLLRKPEL